MIDIDTVQSVFDTFKNSPVASVSLKGIKYLAVGLALINIIKKYNEGIADNSGYSWGLKPADLIKNLTVVLFVIFSDSVLLLFDNLLVQIENSFGAAQPEITSLKSIQTEIGEVPDGIAGIALILAKYTSPLFVAQLVAGLVSIVVWFFDLFIYAFYLVERFFLLSMLQIFFPIVITFAVYDKLRPLAYNFLKLYLAVYLIVPCFFLVNAFSNSLYVEIQTNWVNNLLGIDVNNVVFQKFTMTSAMCFVFLVKMKLYKKSVQFMFRLFTS